MYKLNLDLLAKVLGMMGSVHDGEALEAARAANRMMLNAGVTWLDVLRPEPVRPVYNAVHGNGWQAPTEDDHRVAAQIIIDWLEDHAMWIGDNEPDFLDTVVNWHRPLTEAQQSWFDKIVLRARRNGCPV